MSNVQDRHRNRRVTTIAADSSHPLLSEAEPHPAAVQNSGACSPFVLVCDHAGRATPAALRRLGLPDEAFELHIAWDIGALALAQGLSDRLGACLVHQRYSRLVIDCNRAPGHPGLIVEVSDGVEVPGNRDLRPAQVQARIETIHAPYHAAIGAELDQRQAAGAATVLVCVHSFTPAMAGVPRPWHVGVLHEGASPASEALLRLLRGEPDLVVGDNQPYAMDGTDFTAPHHAGRRGLDVIELEVRQDLIADRAGAQRMADRLARLLPQALSGAGARS
jgi:predicted N-formylglutamate amidohydrolase